MWGEEGGGSYFLPLLHTRTLTPLLRTPLPPSHPPTHLQENAELLTEEGLLLANLQTASSGGGEEGEFDMRGYANKLEDLLRRKHRTTVELLDKITKFQESLAHEEMVSTQMSMHL